MARLRTSSLLVCLALAGADGAGASTAPLAECEAQLSRAPDGEQAALCLSRLAWLPGPFRERAIERLEQWTEEHPDIPWFAIQLARLRHKPASSAEAERLYRQAIDVSARRGLPWAEVFARTGLSRLLRETGRVAEAGAQAGKAAEVAEASGDPRARTRAAIALANHSIFLGELEQAYVRLAGIGSAGPAGDQALEREYLVALANVTLQTGRFQEALDALRRLAALGEAIGDPGLVSSARSGMAEHRKEELSEVPSDEGREEVLALARQALESARAAGSTEAEVSALWTIGSLSGDPAEARSCLERCLELAATLQRRSYCQAVLARRLAGSDPAAAEEAIHSALALAQESRDALSWTSAWHERMRLRWLVAPPAEALADSLSALDAIEALRDQQKGSTRQPGLFSTWADDYYWLSGKLLDTERTEEAFAVVERMRARTLTDALGLPRAKVRPALHARRAEVALAITRIQQKLMGDLSITDREKARSELDRLKTEADGIRLQIQKADPNLASPHQPGFASLEQVRRSLAPDEALLSFQVAPWKDLAGDFGGGSWLLVTTGAGTRTYRLDGRTELRPKIGILNGLFPNRDGSDAEPSAFFYQALLEKPLAEMPRGIRKLVIVPDDTLHRLPFAALRPTPDGDPLAARFEISVVPSATLWLRWRSETALASGRPALVFADPPANGGQASERAATAFADRSRLGPLPLSRKEGESVLDHLGDGLLLLGAEASEARLKSGGAEGFLLLHFATHSWTDDADPELSYVYLAGDKDQDGLLQASEIAELNLHGRTVVLSTCESAAGEILRGEGVMGLARAFFQAGAHPVVASLWPLRDDEGAALFDRFYAHLAKGKSVAAALQGAQLDLIAKDAPAAAWAGVVVLGDGDRVPFPGGRRRSLLPAAIVIALLLLVAAILWRRRSRFPTLPGAQ